MIKQLQGRFNIKNVKMVQHRHFQFFCFHTNMPTFTSTEISCKGWKLMRTIVQSSKHEKSSITPPFYGGQTGGGVFEALASEKIEKLMSVLLPDF